MEPEMRYYDPFIKPLLDKPGSTYRHTQLTGAHAREYWNNYRKALDDPELVGDRPALDRHDPKLRKIDTDTLLIGNLWRRYKITHVANYADPAPLILQHMTYAAMTNEIFQRRGLVRMLWWAPEGLKSTALPNTVRGRKAFDAALSLGAKVTEVAGVKRVETTPMAHKSESARAPEMNTFIQNRVKREMAERGHKLPPGREQPLESPSVKGDEDPHVHNSILKITCKTVGDVEKAITELRNHAQHLRELLPKLRRGKGMAEDHNAEALDKIIQDNMRYEQAYQGLMSRSGTWQLHCSLEVRTRMMLILDMDARLVNVEANYAAVAEQFPKAKGLSACREKVMKLNEDITDAMQELCGAFSQNRISHMLDDIISVEATPPMMQRDRRAYEPLQAHIHEFWPHHGLTLLDVVPHEHDLSSPGIASRVDGARACQDLLRHMFSMAAHSVPSALERVAPNAAQDLIPLAPAVTDARKGGRMDPNKLMVRNLSQEMIQQLVLAFLDWPFKPSRGELALASGASEKGGVPDEGDEDDEVRGGDE